jgi:hypothetical protein
MAYNRYYTQFEDENAWQYTLYILPSNANLNDSQLFLDSTLTTFNLIELPDDFLMKSLSIETELGEIPAGLVSQVMTLNVNLAALQGATNLNELRECLLRGFVQEGNPYQSTQFINNTFSFPRFNTFILMVNDGSGDRPVFIGCQKFAAENELTLTKLDSVINFKIECFDVMRFICENIVGEDYANYFLANGTTNTNALDYGNGYSIARNTRYNDILIGTAYYASAQDEQTEETRESTIDKYSFVVNTFNNLKTLIDSMLTEYMKSVTWNTSSTVSVPIPFSKAWTFYAPRLDAGDSYGGVIDKPAFVSEIYKDENGITSLKGGAIIDSTAFGKFQNFYEVFQSLVENTLEIYRINLSYSIVTGAFGISYTSDFIRPLTASGITFNQSNVYSDIKMKLFQETIKSAQTSVSTLQGEKDTKVFPYQEGTSSDNGKDVELIFHNLPTASNYRQTSDYTSEGRIIIRKSSINAGMIVWNDSGRIKRPDTQCQFKYSNTDSISLNYEVIERDDAVTVQHIIEQQQAGVPYTIAYALVKSLGDSKQVDLEFKTRHSICGFEDVGANCTINLNDLNPLVTQIYNANTGTGVITKHKLDVYSGSVDISIRMFQ